MELELIRDTFTEKSTIGRLYSDGNHECYLLEDKDRGLDSTMTLEQINKLKVFGQTCIPYGRYKVIVTKSERFSKAMGHDIYLPLLLKVPGFDGCRFHPGNKPEDTEGCPLTGTEKNTDSVSNSKTAFIRLNEKINNALKKGEDVYITIKKSGL